MAKRIYFSVAERECPEDLEQFYHDLATPVLSPLDTALAVNAVQWDNLWQFAQSKAASFSGLHVSEVGSTWLGSLASTGGLKPFSSAFLADVMPQTAFQSEIQKMNEQVSSGQNLFLPWLLDVRVIYYHREHLHAAHIDEGTAFSTIENMNETMEKLKSVGHSGWGATTFSNINTLYNLASWVWATGDDFLTDDRLATSFCDDIVLDAMKAYFDLGRFMPGPFESQDTLAGAFNRKEISAFMSGPWTWSSLCRDDTVDAKSIGISRPPGPSFWGGSNLVMWQHAFEDVAHETDVLLQFLMSPEAQTALHRLKGLLPVHRSVIGAPPFTSDPNYIALLTALGAGRHLPVSPLWAHLEDSLVRVFGLVWQSLKHNDFTFKQDMLKRHLEPLAKRFDRMLTMF